MATFLEESVYCPECDRNTLARSRSVNHVLHLLVSVLMCGWWLIVWGLLALTWTPNWLCTRCGTPCDGPKNTTGRVIGAIALCAFLIPVAGCAGLFIFGVYGANRAKDIADRAPKTTNTESAEPTITPPPTPATTRPTASTPRPTTPTGTPATPKATATVPTAAQPAPIEPAPAPRPTTPAPNPPITTSPPAPGTPAPLSVPFTHVVTPPKNQSVPLAKNKIVLDAYLEAELLDKAKAKKMIADAEVVLVKEPLGINVEGDAVKGVYFCRPVDGPAKGKLWVVDEKYVTKK